MRFSVKFAVAGDEKKIPLQYRNMFLSIMKKIFENGSEAVYDSFYGENKNVVKPFCFAVYLPKPKWLDDEVEIEGGNLTLNFSTSDMEKGIYFFNGLLKQEGKEFSYKNYKLKIEKINMGKEKVITSRETIFKTLSPIVVRVHNREENRDEYITAENPKFIEEFEKTLKARVEVLTGLKREIKAEVIDMKKNVIKHKVGENKEKEIMIDVSSGVFKLTADIDVLDLLYKAGVGGRTGEGFGMVEVV